MAETDLINLQLVQDAYDTLLNNGVADDSITPAVDNGMRSDAMKSIAFFGKLKWTIDPSGVPTSGQITLNNDFDTATSISVFKTDAHGKVLNEALDLIDSGSVLLIGDYEGNYGTWEVTAKVDNTTYFTFTVNANANNPSYTPTGLEGVMTFFGGAGGGGGGDTDTNGVGKWDFNNTTSSPPSSGQIRFNNGTIGSATELYVHDTDLDSVDRGVILNTLTANDYFIIQQYNNPSNFALVEFSSVTDNTTYVTYGINSITVVGTFTNGADFFLLPLKAGGGGSNTNIILNNLVQLAARTQDLGGFLQLWQNGIFGLSNVRFAPVNSYSTYVTHPVDSQEYDLGNTSTNLVVDLSKGNYFIATATDNFTLNFSNAPTGTDVAIRGYVYITQDGTGSRVLSKGTNVVSAGGITPLLSTTASAVDIVEFTYREASGDFIITGVLNDIQ